MEDKSQMVGSEMVFDDRYMSAGFKSMAVNTSLFIHINT